MLTSGQFNKLFVIESLGAEDLHSGQRLVQEVSSEFERAGVAIEFVPVRDRSEFLAAMDTVWQKCAGGNPAMYPMIHIDAHGAEDKSGILLSPSGDIVLWEHFVNKCRRINQECHNNLLVTASLCFGLLAILSMTMNDLAPFLVYVGPEDIVSAAEADCFSSFYAELVRTASADQALDKLRSQSQTDKFGMFVSERHFITAFARYIRECTQGSGRRARVERLLSQYNRTRHPGKRLPLAAARKILKQRSRPDSAAFERFKERFLLSDHPNNAGRFECTFEDALQLARELD